jgi:phospholipase/lecithinase/hemolysin
MKLGAIFWIIIAAALLVTGEATAQPFTQVIVFGDSNVDSGFFKALSSPGGSATFNSDWSTAVAHGAGAPTSSPNPMGSQMLASYFGLTANPSNKAGGTNYATSGAKNVTVNNAQTGGFTEAIPTVTQITNYLSEHSGVADGQALYLIYSGDNDVSYADGGSGTGPYPTNPTAYVETAAEDLAAAIENLYNDGARHIIVSGLAYSFPGNDANLRALRLAYTNTLWDTLTTANVPFYRGDIDTVRVAIAADPAKYGFTNISTGSGQVACTQPTNVSSSWALLCSSDTSAPSTWVSPTAPFTDLFADNEHLATAGQQYMARYFRNLVVPPTVLHDFDGDAKSDILWHHTSGKVAIWKLNGLQPPVFLNSATAATAWQIAGSGDFNGDGNGDILWRNTSGQVAVWLMNGAQIKATATIATASSNWTIVGTGDFDGDGKTDVLWHQSGTGKVAIWKMNGTLAATFFNPGSATTDWQVAGVGDFDGDGKADILWRNTNGKVAVWLMNGGTIKSTATVGTATSDWTVAGTGDFDGDGMVDILWHNTSTGKVAIWEMNGTQVKTYVNSATATTDWQIAGTGDFDGDGKSDILWRNSNGKVAVWLMNGGQVKQSKTIGTATSDWSITPQ